jgi:hypothetical protein
MRKTGVSELSLIERLRNITGTDTFQRVDENHVLDLYIGRDSMSRCTLFLIADIEPMPIFSARIINVSVGLRHDNKWGILFSLVDNNFEDLFCHFCEDMIESSRSLSNKKQGSIFICKRYEKWQDMLAKYKDGLLSESHIKGLVGELYFLKEVLIPMYGEEMAINSWIGPDQADQDFICGEIWYEVKSTVSGSESIKISSIEQLDTNREGELVVVYLDKTSYADESKITLNVIYKEVADSLSDINLKYRLSDILLNLGYCMRIEYDEYRFKFSGLIRYKVNNEFPCVRRLNIPQSIVSVKYDLSLSFISKFIKE